MENHSELFRRIPYQSIVKRRNRREVIKAIYEGKRTFKELLESTGLSKPVLTEHIKEIEKEGIIKGKKSEEDRRKIYYELAGAFKRAYAFKKRCLYEEKVMPRLSSYNAEWLFEFALNIADMRWILHKLAEKRGIDGEP